MNNEYYGAPSTPTSDFLAHYGVRGMKWGVRKALHKGSDKALNKAYQKAQKKLKKYSDKMNLQKQKNEAGYHAVKAAKSSLASTAGIGTAYSAIKLAYSPYINHTPGVQAGSAIATGVSALGAVVASGKAGYHAGKSIAAKMRSTEKGHKKAVAKYSRKAAKWQKEMDNAFKGTPYERRKKNNRTRRKTTNG